MACRLLLTLVLPAVSWGCSGGRSSQPQQKPSALPALTHEQCRAIRVAEEFIAENGYTTRPPMPDKQKIAREPSEENTPVDRLLMLRRGQLKPHANGLVRDFFGGEGHWTVLFEFDETWLQPEPGKVPLGRGVSVRIDRSSAVASMQTVERRLDLTVARLKSEDETAAACRAATEP